MVAPAVIAAWLALGKQVGELLTKLFRWPRPKAPARPAPPAYRKRPPAPPPVPVVFPVLLLGLVLLTACAGAPALQDTETLKVLCEQVVPCEPCPAAPAIPPDPPPAPEVTPPPAPPEDPIVTPPPPDEDQKEPGPLSPVPPPRGDLPKKWHSFERGAVREVELYQFAQPAKLDILVDDGEASGAGVSVVTGPGWAIAPRPGAVGGRQRYITRNGPKAQDGSERAYWWPTVKKPGRYEVWITWRASANRARWVPYYLALPAGTSTWWVNQRIDDEEFGGVKWARLGTFAFPRQTAIRGKPPSGAYLRMVNGPDHSEGIDALGLRWVGP
jgi:hypothetical protein